MTDDKRIQEVAVTPSSGAGQPIEERGIDATSLVQAAAAVVSAGAAVVTAVQSGKKDK